MSVEKFTGSFAKEDSGCTIIINQTIQSITDPTALGLYCYLLTKPPLWEINVKELMAHFSIGRDKVRSCLFALMELKLLTRYDIRENGEFRGYHYVLHLKPLIESGDSPETEIPAPVNQAPYITNTIKEKKDNTNTQLSPEPENSVKKPKLELMDLINIYREEFPNNPQPHKRTIATSLFRTLKTFIKRWPEADPGGNQLDLKGFRQYMVALKEYAPNFALNEYVTTEGNRRKNGLETFCRWNTFVKFLEDAYS